MMRQSDRKLCVYAAVRREAECNTDHQFLCAKIKLNWRCSKPKTKQKGARFDVTRLAANGSETRDSLRQVYVEGVLGRARRNWPEEGKVEQKWSVLKSVLIDTATDTLGKMKLRQPDWFSEF